VPIWVAIDDEPDILELMLALFEAWGIDGLAFADGEAVLA
jgi:hypothetical protein